MPMYDFKCKVCGLVFERIVNSNICEFECPVCFDIAEKIFSGTKFIPFKPYIETNLGDKPVEIKSKKQLRQECNKCGADYV